MHGGQDALIPISRIPFRHPPGCFRVPTDGRPSGTLRGREGVNGGVVRLGLPGLGVRPGDHICALYLGPAERDEILTPYLRAGLRAGEKCLCLISDVDLSEVIASIDESLDVEGCSRREPRPGGLEGLL